MLEAYIQANFGRVVSLGMARQFAFSIFSVLDSVPAGMRHVDWTRERIAYEFAALARSGVIDLNDETDATNSPTHQEYWERVIEGYMTKRLEFDWDTHDRLIRAAGEKV